jgi:MFS family permease
VAAYVAGPVLGGVLASNTDPGLVLLLDGASFAGMLVVVAVAVPSGRGATAGEGRDAPPVSGWAVLRRVPVAAWLFVVDFLVDLFYMPVDVTLPLLVRGPLHASGAALGEIWTGFGVGAVAGAIAVNYLRRLPQITLLVVIIAGWAGCVIAVSLAPSVWAAAIAFAVGGLIWAPFGPIAYNLVQAALAPDEQQPVLTMWAAGVTIAQPLGLIVGGPLVQATGTRGGLAASAILTLLLVPIAARTTRSLRRGQLVTAKPEYQPP